MRNSKIVTKMDSILDSEARAREAREELLTEISCKNDVIALMDKAITNVINSTDSPVFVTDLGNYSTKDFSDLNNWIERNKDKYLVSICEKMLAIAKENQERHEQPVDSLAKALAEAEL